MGGPRAVRALVGAGAVALALALLACRGGAQEALPTLTPSPPDRPPPGIELEFPKTDLSRHSVPYSEILSGGPPRDGIPAIDDPEFITVEEAAAQGWLRPREPVVVLEIEGDVRAYPLQILIWHEIVNDVVGGVPVAVTWCPLCNTAIVFDRRLEGMTLDFGTTGRLRFSNLVMYDRQTESWWQQATGEAIVGELMGKRLEFLPANVVSWQEFMETYPQGLVLSRDTGFDRPYGTNPYVGYDDSGRFPFLYRGPVVPGKLPPMARVLAVDLGGEAVAYPYEALRSLKVVNDTVGGEPIVVFWAAGVASPLDDPLTAEGRDVGTAVAYSRRVGERVLTFEPAGDRFRDRETGSLWEHTGTAVDGPMKGERLRPVVAVNHFWFSWVAFRPQTRIYSP